MQTHLPAKLSRTKALRKIIAVFMVADAGAKVRRTLRCAFLQKPRNGLIDDGNTGSTHSVVILGY